MSHDHDHDHGPGCDHDIGDYLRTVRENVARFGWHAALVQGSRTSPPLAYTIGAFTSWRVPEVAIVGLPDRTAHAILTDVVKHLREGLELAPGRRYDQFLNDYPVEFRPIHEDHYHAQLGMGVRFHGGTDFPALQCVWPDREGRFPWEPGGSIQHLLLDQPWPFPDPLNRAVFTTRHVLAGAPVLLVTHDPEDGAWQLLCGSDDLSQDDARLVSLGGAVRRDPTLLELWDLPTGWRAWRDAPGDAWQREPEEPEG